MVYERREEPTEQQVHRHAVSHLPTGMDPVFPVNGTSDPKNGEVLVFINGTWTTMNIQNVVNNFASVSGGTIFLPYPVDFEDSGTTVPGAPGAAGAQGATGASGSGGGGGTGDDTLALAYAVAL